MSEAKMGGRGWLVIASILAMLAAAGGACGGASMHGREVEIEPRRDADVLDELVTEQGHLDEALNEALRRPEGADCAAACELGARICDLSARICGIADRRAGDAEVGERCADASRRCESSRERVAERCSC